MDGAREVAWAVTRAREQVTEDFETLVTEVEKAWTTLFPQRLGYATRTQLISDQGIRLVVRRGDFEGSCELACDLDGQIRAVSSARSQRLIAAEVAGQRVALRARAVATSIGGLCGIGFCWLAAGAQMPVIGGLMLTIIMACLLVGGGSLGARVGEGVASLRRLRAERAISEDASVQADIRRWNGLSRQLRSHRRALARQAGGSPFRRPALG